MSSEAISADAALVLSTFMGARKTTFRGSVADLQRPRLSLAKKAVGTTAACTNCSGGTVGSMSVARPAALQRRRGRGRRRRGARSGGVGAQSPADPPVNPRPIDRGVIVPDIIHGTSVPTYPIRGIKRGPVRIGPATTVLRPCCTTGFCSPNSCIIVDATPQGATDRSLVPVTMSKPMGGALITSLTYLVSLSSAVSLGIPVRFSRSQLRRRLAGRGLTLPLGQDALPEALHALGGIRGSVPQRAADALHDLPRVVTRRARCSLALSPPSGRAGSACWP